MVRQWSQGAHLQVFFSGYPSIYGLQYFPNLKVLMIMGQAMTSMDGLQHCQVLQELWIAECAITVTERFNLFYSID